jgi:hypothetical protein
MVKRTAEAKMWVSLGCKLFSFETDSTFTMSTGVPSLSCKTQSKLTRAYSEDDYVDVKRRLKATRTVRYRIPSSTTQRWLPALRCPHKNPNLTKQDTFPAQGTTNTDNQVKADQPVEVNPINSLNHQPFPTTAYHLDLMDAHSNDPYTNPHNESIYLPTPPNPAHQRLCYSTLIKEKHSTTLTKNDSKDATNPL